MDNQVRSVESHRRRVRARCHNVLTRTGYLTLTVLLVSLFSLGIAANSLASQQRYQSSDNHRPEHQQQRRQSVVSVIRDPQQSGPRSVPIKRPTGLLQDQADNNEPGGEADSVEADDERFLSQLRLAAHYLDERLALARQQRQREEALRPLLNLVETGDEPPSLRYAILDEPDRQFPHQGRPDALQVGTLGPRYGDTASRLDQDRSANVADAQRYYLATETTGQQQQQQHPPVFRLPGSARHPSSAYAYLYSSPSPSPSPSPLPSPPPPQSPLSYSYSYSYSPDVDAAADSSRQAQSQQPSSVLPTTASANVKSLLNYMLLLDKARGENDQLEQAESKASDSGIETEASKNSGSHQDKRQEFGDGPTARQQQKTEQQAARPQQGDDAIKYTTLLEDEQHVDGANRSSADTADIGPPTTVTYGNLLVGGGPDHRPSSSEALVDVPAQQAPSLLSWAYNKLASFLPLFGQAGATKGVASTGASRPSTTLTEIQADDRAEQQQRQSTARFGAGSNPGSRAGTMNDDKLDDNNDLRQASNQSVSALPASAKGQLEGGEQRPIGVKGNQARQEFERGSSSSSSDSDSDRIKDQSEQPKRDNSDKSKIVTNDDKEDEARDKQSVSVKVRVDKDPNEGSDRLNGAGEPDGGFIGQFAEPRTRVKGSSSKRLSVPTESEGGADDDLDLGQMIQMQQPSSPYSKGASQSRGFNMIRQSEALMLPLGAENHLLVQGDGSRKISGGDSSSASSGDESLVGRYIYAPTQHYYLNAMPQSHGPGGGKNGLGSAYETLKPAYAFQKDPSALWNFASLINAGGVGVPAPTSGPQGPKSSSNDLYFLVVVGAFCVMAMAVVLAAGMFAYRVQQQRKSSQEPDYPTYGVVGPNNMSGKCGGAAALVGGYFGQGGSSGATSKSGSAKHLADMYAAASGLDSGLNSLDKSSTTSNSSGKKSLSTSGLSAASAGAATGAKHSSSNPGVSPANCQDRTGSSGQGALANAGNQDAARMYHYQHQKQQMIISDRNSTGRRASASDLDSEEENDDGSYTVYECPGLASAHEMEIKNPLFNDDQSP